MTTENQAEIRTVGLPLLKLARPLGIDKTVTSRADCGHEPHRTECGFVIVLANDSVRFSTLFSTGSGEN